jgi:hypothetical protein
MLILPVQQASFFDNAHSPQMGKGITDNVNDPLRASHIEKINLIAVDGLLQSIGDKHIATKIVNGTILGCKFSNQFSYSRNSELQEKIGRCFDFMPLKI